MSIAAALSNALSGLNASARQAEVLASNVANATTPGYAKRSVQLSSASLGGQGQGVRVTGILRHSDLFLLNDRRAAGAALAESSVRASFLTRAEKIIGTTETPGALVRLVQQLDTALLEAASQPQSAARLSSAVLAAKDLASGLNIASAALQQERSRADSQIGSLVQRLNEGLKQVEALNSHIASYAAAGQDVSALLDQRQAITDEISQIIPIREIPREGMRIALVAPGGLMLLDGRAAEFEFSPVHLVVADMSLESGSLSGLRLNGREINMSTAAGPVRGGELAGLFAIRDEMAVKGQQLLDAFAREMIERFSAPGLDATLPAGHSGLFTDVSAVFDPQQEPGLSARIRINAALDDAAGGSAFRLRDGLGALSPGQAGDSALLSDLAQVLGVTRNSSSPSLPGSFSLPVLAATVLSEIGSQRLSAEREQSYESARFIALTDLEAAGGVDTDDEMARLLTIEKAYAANARVLQVVDDLLKTLLGL